MTPKQSTCGIKDFNFNIHLTAYTIMIDDKLRVSLCWILCNGYAKERWSQVLHDLKVKPCGRRIIQNIPRFELQSVLTWCKFGYIIIGCTTCIATKVVLKVVIQHIGFIHIIVNNEFKIVPNTAS